MISKKNKKGFTLMEMLIVVAIIVILIAIMIPTFNGQLEKTREAADAANIRAAYAEVMVNYLSDDTSAELSKEVNLQQTADGWATTDLETNLTELAKGSGGSVTGTPKGNGTCTVSIDANTGAVTIAFP